MSAESNTDGSPKINVPNDYHLKLETSGAEVWGYDISCASWRDKLKNVLHAYGIILERGCVVQAGDRRYDKIIFDGNNFIEMYYPLDGFLPDNQRFVQNETGVRKFLMPAGMIKVSCGTHGDVDMSDLTKSQKSDMIKFCGKDLRRGDVMLFYKGDEIKPIKYLSSSDVPNHRCYGYIIFDGKNFVNMADDGAYYNMVPKEFGHPEFPLAYFIDSCISRNPWVHLSQELRNEIISKGEFKWEDCGDINDLDPNDELEFFYRCGEDDVVGTGVLEANINNNIYRIMWYYEGRHLGDHFKMNESNEVKNKVRNNIILYLKHNTSIKLMKSDKNSHILIIYGNNDDFDPKKDPTSHPGY